MLLCIGGKAFGCREAQAPTGSPLADAQEIAPQGTFEGTRNPHGAPSLAIVGVNVVDPIALQAIPDQTILIAGDSIVAIASSHRLTVPDDVAVLQGEGRWAISGLVDGHVHFFQSASPYTQPDVVDLTSHVPYEQEVARTQEQLGETLRAWLACGVTAVADLGGPNWTFTVRQLAKADPAPHVALAGPLLSTVARPELDHFDPPIVKVQDPSDARQQARRQLTRDPDFLKFWFIPRHGEELAEQQRLVQVVAEEAHSAKRRLVVHATELRVAKAALRAGADILAHSVSDEPVDDEFLDLARQRNVLYVTTLFVSAGYQLALSGAWQATREERLLGNQRVVAQLRDMPSVRGQGAATGDVRHLVSPIALSNLRRVHDAGVTVVLGSDAGNIGTLHGPGIYREIDLMVEAGLSPGEILRAATINGAKLMGMEDRIGALQRGKLADIVLLEADPLVDAAHLAGVTHVIRAGGIFERAELVSKRESRPDSPSKREGRPE